MCQCTANAFRLSRIINNICKKVAIVENNDIAPLLRSMVRSVSALAGAFLLPPPTFRERGDGRHVSSKNCIENDVGTMQMGSQTHQS